MCVPLRRFLDWIFKWSIPLYPITWLLCPATYLKVPLSWQRLLIRAHFDCARSGDGLFDDRLGYSAQWALAPAIRDASWLGERARTIGWSYIIANDGGMHSLVAFNVDAIVVDKLPSVQKRKR